jgi:hypothetical protein
MRAETSKDAVKRRGGAGRTFNVFASVCLGPEYLDIIAMSKKAYERQSLRLVYVVQTSGRQITDMTSAASYA